MGDNQVERLMVRRNRVETFDSPIAKQMSRKYDEYYYENFFGENFKGGHELVSSDALFALFINQDNFIQENTREVYTLVQSISEVGGYVAILQIIVSYLIEDY